MDSAKPRAEALADHKGTTTPFVTWGYHHYFHGELSRDRLNQLAPDVPVIVWHRSAHEFFLNDAALRLTGIDEALVKGFSKSAQEQLSLTKGHFYEQGAMAILGKLTPHQEDGATMRSAVDHTEVTQAVVEKLAALMTHDHGE